jgi:hypothetical protein
MSISVSHNQRSTAENLWGGPVSWKLISHFIT